METIIHDELVPHMMVILLMHFFKSHNIRLNFIQNNFDLYYLHEILY